MIIAERQHLENLMQQQVNKKISYYLAGYKTSTVIRHSPLHWVDGFLLANDSLRDLSSHSSNDADTLSNRVVFVCVEAVEIRVKEERVLSKSFQTLSKISTYLAGSAFGILRCTPSWISDNEVTLSQ